MSYPENFGFPCWEKSQAEKCINIVAQVTPEQAPLFLATHSPIKNIKDVKANKLVTEEEVFQSLFSLEGENRSVVRGASGTGKSHLIRWINLRAEYAAQKKELGLDKFKIVMVQRDTGSLKAALKQIVDQLGDEFSQYVAAIKKSVKKFSEQTARQELIQELALEINNRWEERYKDPLPKKFKRLGNALLSPDYKNWLSRDNGVVARIVARLTESSTQDDREKKILFDYTEIDPEESLISPSRTSEEVYKFLQDIKYDGNPNDKDSFASEVVKILNKVLIDAQRELTGIKSAELNDIFSSIRRKLHAQGKQLAVFIEDVTAASGGLDQDLFRAFEQKKGKDLCRMIALLGMTNVGCWDILPDNDKDRVNFEYDIGESAYQWATDQSEVAKFAARYLNAIRCDDSEIDDLAKIRFKSDVAFSKCDDCPHSDPCYKTFGYVTLEDDLKIGLFPFSVLAPQKLLMFLNQERHRSSPRGLLDFVLNVAVTQSYDNYTRYTFPDASYFGVIRQVPIYWTDFEAKYLGGAVWADKSNRDRPRFLAEFWFEANSANDAAILLEPYRRPFNLPVFSAMIRDTGRKPETQPDPKPPRPPEDKELKDFLFKLDEWHRGKQLSSDSTFRDLLSKMIGKVMRWQDHRGVHIKFASDMTKGIRPIRIEGQTSNVVGQLYFLNIFPRNDETRSLLEALVRYEHQGNKSWNFESGERHKRQVYLWVRKNKQRIIESLVPNPQTLVQDALRAASQLLGFAAIIRMRSSFKNKEPQERMNVLFTEIWEEMARPHTLSNALGKYVEDVGKRWSDAKALIIDELGVGQGDAAPKDFIDPLPILDALDKFEEKLSIDPLPKEISESFWKTRFAAVSKLNAYNDICKALDEEKKAIANDLDELKDFLLKSGSTIKALKKGLADCVDNIVEVIKIQKKNMPYPNVEFDYLWESKRLEKKQDVWGESLEQAEKIIAKSSDIETLCFDSTDLKQVWQDLAIVKNHLLKIEKELGEREKQDGSGGTKKDLLKELELITTVLKKD